MPLKRQLSTQDDPPLYKSSPIADRKSTFIAYFSPTLPAPQLQALPSLQSADHRIAAWREPSKQTTLGKNGGLSGRGGFSTHSDDDGEQWAGKKLEKVLVEENVIGAIVVGRWYGGVMLGKARFEHIENCAREAILRFKGAEKRGEFEAPSKKLRVEEDVGGGLGDKAVDPVELPKMRRALVSELERRDASVLALRGLLDEKRARLSGSSPKPASPAKVVDYPSMSLTRLQALDKARDASIAYLLKELDKVDQELAEEDELDSAFEVAEQNKKKQQEDLDNEVDEQVLQDAWKGLDDILQTKDETTK